MTSVTEDFRPESQPISVGNAANLLKAVVNPNDRPYDAAVKKANNELVEEWKEKVLRNIADGNGQIMAGKVWSSWEVFIEGHNLRHYDELSKHILRLTPEQLEFWKDTFRELNVDELCEYGPGVNDFGWFYMQNEIRLWMTEQKWNRIYSQSDDPLDWEDTGADNRQYLRGEVFPFWDKKELFNAEQKVRTAMKCRARPYAHLVNEMNQRGMKSVTKDKILSWMCQPYQKNDPPYTQVACKYINKMIDTWASLAMTKDEYLLTECPELLESWTIYYEGIGIKKFEEVESYIPRPTDEDVEFWKQFFCKEIEELHSYGTGFVGTGWFMLQNEIKRRATALKAERVFVGDDLAVWISNATSKNNKELMTGNEGSFWSVDELKEHGMKVGTILSLQIAPQSKGPRI